MASTGKCVVCKENSSNYKCPVCNIKYCSVVCYKSHKNQDNCLHNSTIQTNLLQEKDNSDPAEYGFETEDTVPLAKLNMLCTHPGLLSLLKNPHLRCMMSALYKSDNPSEAISEAMKEPIFVEFVNECLGIVEKPVT